MGNELKQLLVHADASPQFAQRLEFACRLAAQYGAGVTALYASPSASEAIPVASGMGPGLAVRREKVQDTELARARSVFEQLRPVGLPAAWAEVHDFPLASAFAGQALYADLLVLGQHGPGEGWSTLMPADFPETVIALSGRPALVLPYTSAKPGLPGRVVIAWKPTRGAARAVTAALPILRNAVVGLQGVDANLLESARGMGMSEVASLLRVRIPLAWPVILAGIRISLQMSMGIAAIAAYVLGPGLGVSIFTGLAQIGGKNAVSYAAVGTVGIVIVALLLDAVLLFAGRLTTSKGIRV
jgi:nucleotide-binding universal stress UspA family protein